MTETVHFDDKDPITASALARTFRVPTSRIYNALGAIGHEGSHIDDETLLKLVVEIQQSAIPFTSLAVEFNEETTLGELAEMEMGLIRQKYKELWEKRSKPPKKKDNVVEFIK